MLDTIISILTVAAPILTQVPVLAKALGYVAEFIIVVPACATGFVGLWHSVVLFMGGLAQLPFLSGLKKVADAMKEDEAVIDDKASVLVNLLNRLSAIPLPKLPAPAPVEAPKPAPAA